MPKVFTSSLTEQLPQNAADHRNLCGSSVNSEALKL